jgi:hypothetical protein
MNMLNMGKIGKSLKMGYSGKNNENYRQCHIRHWEL